MLRAQTAHQLSENKGAEQCCRNIAPKCPDQFALQPRIATHVQIYIRQSRHKAFLDSMVIMIDRSLSVVYAGLVCACLRLFVL